MHLDRKHVFPDSEQSFRTRKIDVDHQPRLAIVVGGVIERRIRDRDVLPGDFRPVEVCDERVVKIDGKNELIDVRRVRDVEGLPRKE